MRDLFPLLEHPIYIDPLPPKQRRAVILLTEGVMTNKEIAKHLQISEPTLYNWKKDVIFQGELHIQALLVLEHIHDTTLSPLVQIMSRSINIFLQTLESEDENLRFQASKFILTMLNDKLNIFAPTELDKKNATIANEYSKRVTDATLSQLKPQILGDIESLRKGQDERLKKLESMKIQDKNT